MMPLDLFRSRNFSGANLLTLLLYGALGGAFFFLPLILIQVHGYTATAAGAAMLPFIVILFLLSRWSGSLVDRYGARGPLVAGPALAALGFSLLAVPGTTGGYWSTFLAPISLIGLGMAVCVAPLTTTVMNSIDARHVGVASGVNNAVSRVASLLAIALLGVLVIGAFGHEMDRRLAKLDLAPSVVASLHADRTHLGALEAPPGVDASDRLAIRAAVNGAFVAGFRLMALAAGVLALASAVVAAATIGDIEPAKTPGSAA